MTCFVRTVLLSTLLHIASVCGVTDKKLAIYQHNMLSRLTAGHWLTVIIYEECYEYDVTTLHRVMAEDIYMVMYKYTSFYKFLGPQMKFLLENATLSDFRDQLNYILFCGEECIDRVMNHVTELDNTIGLRSMLRHFSTWLIISSDPPSRENISLDNVAWMRIDRRTEISRYWTEMHTLLWKERGREWTHVDPSHLSESDRLIATVFPNTLRGLNGRQLILSTLEWPPQIIRENIGGKVSYVGATVDIMDWLATVFNFSFAFVEPSDKLWGQQTENGSWTGVLGMVQRAEADLCPATYGVTPARSKGVDFSIPFDFDRSVAFFKGRSNDVFSWLHLLSSFNWQVYPLGLAAIMWTLLLVIIIQKWSKGKEQGNSWFEIGISVPLRQAMSAISERSSTRILVISWCLFCLVMTAVYTGNLTSVMAVEKHNVPFTTLQELAEQDEYEVGCIEGSYSADILKNSEDPVYKNINNKLKNVKTTKEENYSLHEVLLQRMFVLIGSEDVAQYIRSKTCEIVTMKEKFFPYFGGLPYPRNSPIKKLFDLQLMTLQESGLIDKWFSNWSSKPLNCAMPAHVPHLKTDDLKLAIVICACCVLLTTGVLLMERWMYMKKKLQ